jgi:hypothetical protein
MLGQIHKQVLTQLESQEIWLTSWLHYIFIMLLSTLNCKKMSGLLSDVMEFHDRSSSHRVAAAAVPRLDTGRWLSRLWDKLSRSMPPSVKSASGREGSLLWDISSTRRPDVDLNSSAGMLVSKLWESSNTCKHMFTYSSIVIWSLHKVMIIHMFYEITQWISIIFHVQGVQQKLLGESILVQ